MRSSAPVIAAALLAAAAWPQLAAAQHGQDFVFTDAEGHMVLRFAGARDGLDPNQMEEVVNVSLSTMVHDRLRADTMFEAEPVDAHWADAMAPSLRTHISESGPKFSAIDFECRSSTCRLVLEHNDRVRLSEHQAMMEDVQRVLRQFIDAHSMSFEPVFLMAAYDQDAAIPHIKVFLHRAASQPTASAP